MYILMLLLLCQRCYIYITTSHTPTLTITALPCAVTQVRWFSLSYIITATGPLMSCGDMHFCTLPGDPASRVPAVVPRRLQQSPQCVDKQPPGGNCPAVKCNWADGYWTDRGTGCQHPDIIAGGYCQVRCQLWGHLTFALLFQVSMLF